MSTIVSSILQRFCTCCYKPTISHSSEEHQAPIDTAQDEPAASPQVPIQQEELYPVTWRNTKNSSVDLKGVDNCDAIIRKPQDIDQSALHSVAWMGAKKGSKSWGGEGSSLSSEWEAGASDRPEENLESLPLPWEGIFRRGPVPFDGKSFGPSWRELPVQSIIQEQSESTGDDSLSQKSSSKKKMVMARDTLKTDDLAPATDDSQARLATDDGQARPATDNLVPDTGNKSSPHELSNVDDDDNEPMQVVGQLADDKDSNLN